VDDVNAYQCTAGGAATLSINDVTRAEGNSGIANAAFTISLSEASATTVTVRVSTVDDTATAPSDYTALSNVLVTFAPGITTRTVNVPVLGDMEMEPNETFFVNLSSPTNAAIADGQGVGTITDDDAPPVAPAISINDATVTEGNAGSSNATFTVSLDQPTTVTVTVQVDTADDTATAGSDYTAVAALPVTFLPGETSKTVDVVVSGDRIPEANETFFANLSNATAATIADGQGLGTITNDDFVAGDFNGDLKSDIVWRDTVSTGLAAIWYMDGANKTSAALVTPGPVPGLTWEVQGTGDFNGDGKPDLLWRDQGATGAVMVWFMDGATRTGSALVTPGPMPGLNWRIVGTGDFNGDGETDLVWRDTVSTGLVAIWYMDGVNKTSSALVTPGPMPGVTWQIQGVGDFNGDGKPDLVWRGLGSMGVVAVWYMDGAVRTGAVLVTPSLYPGPTWQIQAVGDYNGDGQSDLVWRDQGSSGRVEVWYMAGATRSSSVPVTPAPMPPLNWRIVGPR
jgi:hypothetical protein